MRSLFVAALALVAVSRGAAAQNEAALRAAFEGKTVVARIDMPATSQGVDVYPLDGAPVNFRELAERLKDNGTALRIGQQVMVTKVVVKKNSHIEFQLGGGGFGTFGDMMTNGSDVSSVAAGETAEEKSLRASIKQTSDKGERKRLERELGGIRSARERENARGAAEAQQANQAREANMRVKRAESGSRFNIRYRQGIPPEGLTPDGVMRTLAQYLDFPGAPPAAVAAAAGSGAQIVPVSATRSLIASAAEAPAPAGGISALRKGQTLREVESLLGPAATAAEVRDGSMTVVKRAYRHEGMQVVASFVSGVLVDFAITPQ